MAEYKLHLSEEKSISLSAAVVRRLIDCGSGLLILWQLIQFLR